ncbi:MAG: hypothetical protein K9H84_02895 [Bacteroidales bacterium]|nr:hypothetical protein [Bacteroidales bacterium]
MAQILGLDLGTNSIGWAVVDKENQQISDAGVRIFPEGVVNLGDGEREQSKNAERREFRQTRRQVARKKIRKIKLLELLIDQGMCPLTHEELGQWKHWKKDEKTAGRGFPESEKIKEWFKLNPYEIRSRALEENITRMEFGRILYHMIQRRGFLSSRKESKDTGAIYKGNDAMVGIDKTREELGNRTLGQYLRNIEPKEGEPYKDVRDEEGNDKRIRGRYTLRDMYVAEFEKIWQRQARQLGLADVYIDKKKTVFLNGGKDRNRNQHRIEYLKKHRDSVFVEEVFLNNNGSTKTLTKVTSMQKIPLHDHLGGSISLDNGDVKFDNKDSVLFFQRPLRSQKKLLGKCRFENNKTPVPASHPDYEEFRAWQFVNTIQFGSGQKIPLEQRDVIVELMRSKKSTFKFAEIPKKLNLTYETFNYEDDHKVIGCPTIAQLSKLFPKDIWKNNYEKIWHDFYFYDDNERLYEKITTQFDAKLKSKDDLDKISLKTEDYGSVSLKAVKNILPFLKKGYMYNDAVVLGGVMNAFNYGMENGDISRWDRFSEYHDEIERDIIRILRGDNKEGEAIEQIKKYLSDPNNDLGFLENDSSFKKLYHHSQDVKQKAKKKKLSEIENLRNPVVQRTMNELRRLVNALLEKYESFDRISVEMGRELKLGKNARQKSKNNIFQNREKNEKAREKLTEFGLAHSRQNIQKVLLFEEIQEKAGKVVCPYSNRTINYTDLLGKENKVQIEHIIPRSVSLDDSFANKTLCDSKFNQFKGDLTPWQFYQQNNDKNLWGANSWDQIERRAYSLLPFSKAKKFTARKKDWNTEEFISRQLNDDRYISKKAKEILSEICDEVLVMPGAVTADLRRLWGLNNILQPVHGVEEVSYQVDEKRSIPYWAVTDQENKIKSLYPQINPKPSLAAEEICFPGYVKKDSYESKLMSLKMNAPDLPDGKYYAKVGIEGPVRLQKKYLDRPKTGEDEIVLRGQVKNGKFNHDSLKRKPIASNELEDGTYFAKFNIIKSKFEIPKKNERPENKNGICLFGTVKDLVFSSYIYECRTDFDDGKYWALLDLDFENVEFTPVSTAKPKVNSDQVVIIGDVNEEGEYTSIVDPDYNIEVDEEPGRYWAVFNIKSQPAELTAIHNPEPKVEKDEKLIEGKIWVDKNTGEIRFDPKKNRDDHRHHAIDAVTIAMTEYRYINELNRYNAQMDERNRNFSVNKPSFPDPWDSFRDDVKEVADGILVSHLKDNPVLKKISMDITKNGKKLHSEGYAVRGQLHKQFVYGKRKPYGKEESFHIRKSLSDLKDNQIKKIVDDRIREIVKLAREKEEEIRKEIKQLLAQKRKEDEEGEKRIEEQVNDLQEKIRNLYTLPNRRGERVPIKKVRIRENLGNTEIWKPTSNLNQYVNPRNNHHVLIYKDHDGNLQEEIVTLWEASERESQGLSKHQLPENGKEIITTLEVNDMFLIGLPEELSDKVKDDKINTVELSQYLYRVQKLSSMYYTFRHHLTSSIQNEDTEIRIVSFKAWQEKNPIKVEVNMQGILREAK